ncbi:ribosome small subunit-dependent GTPase A [Thioalkalivibrio sp. XN8]|nr:ribosome small subunit-dependent GTPase A [Thioalkalivibrio sp. XN8]
MEGQVVAAYGQRLLVEDDEGRRYPAFIARRGLRVVCGDRVRWLAGDTADRAVVEQLPRSSELRRPDSRGRGEVLAANITQLVVVCAPSPAPDPFIIDRYLAAAEVMGADAAIVANKTDLAAALPAGLLEEYESLGYPVLRVSAATGTGLDALALLLREQRSLLAGQSGVGKSSLLNALVPGIEAATAGISAATGEGRHRTTATTLHRLSCGGELLDSPGVRDFAPALDDPRLAAAGFREIVAAAQECRFANCRHMKEPGCAVKAGVETGRISPRRYESYRRLLRLTEDLQQRG